MKQITLTTVVAIAICGVMGCEEQDVDEPQQPGVQTPRGGVDTDPELDSKEDETKGGAITPPRKEEELDLSIEEDRDGLGGDTEGSLPNLDVPPTGDTGDEADVPKIDLPAPGGDAQSPGSTEKTELPDLNVPTPEGSGDQ